MPIELVTFKLESEFLKQVDKTLRKSGYSSRTDFIRNALREKMEEIRMKESLIRLGQLKGVSTRKTTDDQIHVARERVIQQLIKKV